MFNADRQTHMCTCSTPGWAVKCHTVTDLTPPSPGYAETLKQLLGLSLKPDRHTSCSINKLMHRQLILTTVNPDTV